MYSHLFPYRRGDDTEGTSSFGLEEVGIHAGRGDMQIQILKSRHLNSGGRGGGRGSNLIAFCFPPPPCHVIFSSLGLEEVGLRDGVGLVGGSRRGGGGGEHGRVRS